MKEIYLNKVAIGGFVTNPYWSSSEYNYESGIFEDFNNGSHDGLTKGEASYVRCAKSF